MINSNKKHELLTITAVLEHNFFKDCPLKVQYSSFLILMALIYLLISLFWYYYTWIIYREHSITLQKILIVLSIFKIQTCLLGAFYSS